MHQTPLLTYSEQKSIFNILGRIILILNENNEVEVVSAEFLKMFNYTEIDIIGKKWSDITLGLGISNQIKEIFDTNNEETGIEIQIAEKLYIYKYIPLNENNDKYLVSFEEVRNKLKKTSKRVYYDNKGKVRKKQNYKVFLNEYGVFLKIFKEIPVAVAIIKKTDFNNLVVTTYNEKFSSDFNIQDTNIFNELFIGFPTLWIQKNLNKISYSDLKEYKEYYYKSNDKYFNLYFKYLTNGLYLLSVIDSTEKVRLQRTMINSIYDSIDNERERISRDLHDGLGALLSSVMMRMNVLKSGKLNLEKATDVITDTCELVKMAIDNTSEIAHNIKPYELSESDFFIALNSLIEKVKKASGIEILFINELNNSQLSEKVEIHLFRIISELLNNTIKHASASIVKLKIGVNNKRVYLDYKDNGIGISETILENRQEQNLGIQNIINRTRELEGACRFNSESGKGMRFRLLV